MRKKLLFVLHLLIVLTTAASVGSYFFGETDPLGGFGTRCFRYFTTDSNILACIGSLVYLLFTGKQQPRWAVLLRYAGTVSVTITLLTVIFFLGPTAAAGSKGLQGFLMFFEGNVFVLHFSTPVLSLLAFLLTEKPEGFQRKHILWGMLPLVLYSLVYLTMVAILHQWPDWYGFTFGGKYALIPVVMLVMYSFAALISWACITLQRKLAK